MLFRCLQYMLYQSVSYFSCLQVTFHILQVSEKQTTTVAPTKAQAIRTTLQPKSELFPRSLFQTLSMLRMSDVNQRSRSFSERLSIQIRDSVLRDHKSHMRSGSDDSRSLPQESDNLAISLLRRGRHSDNRLAPLRPRRPIYKIDLSAKPGEYPRSDRVADDLSGEIDLNGGVNGDHLGHLRDDEGIVGESDVSDENGRIVVHEPVRLLGPHHEAGRRTPPIQRLLPVIHPQRTDELVGDGAGLDEVDHPVRKHLAVHAQAFVALQVRHYGVRNHPNSGLQRRAVLHQIVRDQLPDLQLHLVLLCGSAERRRPTRKHVFRNGTVHIHHFV